MSKLLVVACLLYCSQASAQSRIAVSYDVNVPSIAVFAMPEDGSPFPNAQPTDLTHDEIVAVEDILKGAVTDYNRELEKEFKVTRQGQYSYNRTRLEDWKVELDNYKRQYMPLINDKGEKEVWINCMCNKDVEGESWKESLYAVADGGNCYFKLMVNITANKYYRFMVNGH